MTKRPSTPASFRLSGFLRNVGDPIYQLKRKMRRHMAAAWRRRLSRTTFVGVTGSHGKTTTTALLGIMLERTAPTYVKKGRNTAKDAVRTVLRTLPWHCYSVQEVSGDRPGAVGDIVKYLRPSVGIVTAIGGDHRQAFGGSWTATAAEKAKLVHSLPASGLAVLNADDPLVAGMGVECRCRVVVYGHADGADLRLLSATSIWPDRLALEAEYHGQQFRVQTRLVGQHWSISVLAALLSALELGVPLETCLNAIEDFEPLYNRMSVHPGPNGAVYVLDANKASYSGIETCLEFLDDSSAPRKTVVLGTFADYSGSSRSHYYSVARAALNKADRVIFTGQNAARVRRMATEAFSARLFVIERPGDVLRLLSEDAVPNEVVYIKATRADRLARVFAPEH